MSVPRKDMKVQRDQVDDILSKYIIFWTYCNIADMQRFNY